MNAQPPKGWRYTTSKDDIGKLLRTGKLSQLCKCGHTEGNHREMLWDKHCFLCPCDCFTWVAYLVEDPDPDLPQAS